MGHPGVELRRARVRGLGDVLGPIHNFLYAKESVMPTELVKGDKLIAIRNSILGMYNIGDRATFVEDSGGDYIYVTLDADPRKRLYTVYRECWTKVTE